MIFWYVKMFYHQGLCYVTLVLNSTLLQGNFHWKNWMTSRVKNLLHMTEKLNLLQTFGAFVELLFFHFYMQIYKNGMPRSVSLKQFKVSAFLWQ